MGNRHPSDFAQWLWELVGGDPAMMQSDGPAFRIFDNLTLGVLGVIALATLPFITHPMVLAHDGIARGMLGAFPSDELKLLLRDVSASHGAAVAAEGDSLRRLERDIHAGPQQRLVRLQMDLAAAERHLATDPTTALTLIEEAKLQSQSALEELRALSRGFAPPILLDRGLVTALESLASRNSKSVTVSSALSAGVQFPPEIERNAYFVASELVTNATKHSGANSIGVRVALRHMSEGADSGVGNAVLDVTVTDNGIGGTTPHAEGGWLVWPSAYTALEAISK